jgi:hypothetical protein
VEDRHRRSRSAHRPLAFQKPAWPRPLLYIATHP